MKMRSMMGLERIGLKKIADLAGTIRKKQCMSEETMEVIIKIILGGSLMR
ncbi:hypothetical protein RchiOBHm_Chr4g0405871 [Rosa chinensis]|uniref:Uncharacterized protein n=1 Tax=Rosa chinensis TaxID=74649 RepID=A0A2P6QU70_ROSCH|nr:hypothetical protein RchiOBHm_Chr4g0405871 [Rosa chinensis]